MQDLFNEKLVIACFNSAVFAVEGIILMMLGYFLLDKVLLRKIHFTDELKKGNTGLGIVIGAFLLGVALIVFGVTN